MRVEMSDVEMMYEYLRPNVNSDPKNVKVKLKANRYWTEVDS